MQTKTYTILASNPVGNLATINENHTPWVTPLHLLYDEGYIYWLSSTQSQHSQNITARPQVSLSVWSPDESKGLTGLFIQSLAEVLDAEETERIRRAFTERFGRVPPALNGAAAYRVSIGKVNENKSFGNCIYIDDYKGVEHVTQ